MTILREHRCYPRDFSEIMSDAATAAASELELALNKYAQRCGEEELEVFLLQVRSIFTEMPCLTHVFLFCVVSLEGRYGAKKATVSSSRSSCCICACGD